MISTTSVFSISHTELLWATPYALLYKYMLCQISDTLTTGGQQCHRVRVVIETCHSYIIQAAIIGDLNSVCRYLNYFYLSIIPR
jgi:hypothetical protein